ncbi:MAG: PEP/pyruvate-binding domain-containing protein [Bacteroidota bacterium]
MNSRDKKDNDINKVQAQANERLKELAAINHTTQILYEGKSMEETLSQIVDVLPPAWQYPEYTASRITFGELEFTSRNFMPTSWMQKQNLETIDGIKGSIEVFYLKEFPELDEGPFMTEERHLINNLAVQITGYLNSIKGRFLLGREKSRSIERQPEPASQTRSQSRQLLQKFLNKSNYDRDIYHDLMPFKVREILLVATLYDAYSIEKEGRFSEHVLGEYHQLNLTSLPRITGVSNAEEAMEQLRSKHFDLVILMLGTDKQSPIDLSSQIKNEYPYIPVFLLLNNNSDMGYVIQQKIASKNIDKVFVWNGESQVFFAMIKHVEDKINVENDTSIGMVRVILLVEDSPQYYSRYLPLLYNIVLEQTKRIIDDVSTDELYKVLKLRARPKILLASDYESAIEIVDKYRDYLLCLITDVKFNRNRKEDHSAGIKLVKYARENTRYLPIIIQSSDESNAEDAFKLKATFINKNSESLSQDFKSFITHYLGFGNFIYRNSKGKVIGIARSLKEFEKQLIDIPDESLIHHARKDHFSMWLMARGEIQAAKILSPHKVSDFGSPEKIRQYMLGIISKFRNEQEKGKIIPFDKTAISDETNIVSLSEGSLGGKGRGIAFINTLIYNYEFNQHIPNIHVKAPKTLLIGTEEFEYFMDRNGLKELVLKEKNYTKIKKAFLKAPLTDTLIKRLKLVLGKIKEPIAIRSSGLFEDSLIQPFAGIFETYILPNNHKDPKVRLQQAMDAIKLVYASIYSETARAYVEAINYKIDEEKMAVVIQEVVGNRFGEFFYPHISGVAQSYNYYPVSHMKPEEGFTIAAVGLGKYVVEGEKAFRFSPKYPEIEINSSKDQYKNSQVKFFAVNLENTKPNLLEGDIAGLTRLDIDEAERHDSLKHCASVFHPDSDQIFPGLTHSGPRIINFANILKYNYVPLAKTIEVVLDVVKEAMGSPVEIEFAVDLKKDKNGFASFYLLQIKPLLGNASDYNINLDKIKKENIIMYSEKGMGNGVIENIYDFIFVDPLAFNKAETQQIAAEISSLNAEMVKNKKKYILIGPGRWGTRDPWIGIPVTWPQISNAGVIIETSLEDFPLDASSGSHFFHNVTSMNVGYFTVQPEMSESYIRYDKLDAQKLIKRTKYIKHVRFDEALKVRMDGKKRISVITID